MPLFDFSTSDYYDKSYQHSNGYYRVSKDYIWYKEDPEVLNNSLNIQPNDSILLIGAGFGWLAEEWTNMGLGPICCTDTSPWIQANTQTETAPNITIHNLDINVAADRDAIKAILNLGPNDKLKWAITENMITCLTDQECVEISNNMRLIAETVVHITNIPPKIDDPDWVSSTPPEFRHNVKSGSAWKLLLPNDVIVRFPQGTIF